MNINDMKLGDLKQGDLKQIAAMLANSCPPQLEHSSLIGQHVVVRTYSAGVHIGTLVAKSGENVLLKDAFRLWKWAGAFTLSEVSQNGVSPNGSRMSRNVPLIELTNAIEIIPTSETARASFSLK